MNHTGKDQLQDKTQVHKRTEGEKDERVRGELKENPNESMQKKYAPDQFEFSNKEIQSEEKQEDKDAKPKYKKDDFFDSLTNSTLEEKRPQRGGRGRGRGADFRQGDYN